MRPPRRTTPSPTRTNWCCRTAGSIDEVLSLSSLLQNVVDHVVVTFLGYKFPWFASPPVQLVIVSFVCFMCPGMFNALNGMGGGGQLDPTANNKANTALYSTFAVVGFFAGTFTNKLGIRTALSFGGIGYSVYVASYLSYNHTQNLGFTTFAGALLGVCAGLLWCAQGAIMMSYPPEESKGRYISWFWMIFNLGAVIGSLVCHALLLRATPATNYAQHLLIFTDSPGSEHQHERCRVCH
jgi:MFS family permease